MEYSYDYCMGAELEERTLKMFGRDLLEQETAVFHTLYFMYNYNFLKKDFNDHHYCTAYDPTFYLYT